MQSDPQDEQSELPASRDGEPQEPVGDEPATPSSEAPAPPPKVAPRSATPPRMPAPPQMPAAGAPPSAWGSPPPPSPATPDGEPARSSREGSAAADALPSVEHADDPDRDVAAEVDPADTAAVAPEGDPGPAVGVIRPAPRGGVAPVVQGDWLASVCPYLTSEDGTYRSAAPDEGHRCTAQEPAATLPLAFQERYCLTDRHPRCEMYKFAQETDTNGGIPAAAVPPTEPPTPRTRPAGGGGPSRPLLALLTGIGGVLVVVLLVLGFMGSCSGGDGGSDPDADLVPDEQATEAPADASTPTPTPEPDPDDTPEPDVGTGDTIRILYEIQPDEALRRISETFGITRNRIRRENPELEEVTNAEMPGMIIVLPIVGEMTLADAEVLPGYVGLVSELEADAESEAGSEP